MGEEAAQTPPPTSLTPSTHHQVAAAAAAALEFEASCLSDDDILALGFLDDPSVSNKQEGEAQEGEEELEWLSNSDAFPQLDLDTCVSFGPTTDSVALEELESLEAGKWQTEKVRVPTKRRSEVLRRPRQDFFNLPFLLPVDGKNEKQFVSVRRCTHCLVDETPQWRQGPAGPATLCNACGVRYKSGRLYDEYRPANSPTFSPRKHSNFHRKVLEMRGGKQQTDGGVISNSKGVRQSRLGRSEFSGEVHDSVGGLDEHL